MTINLTGLPPGVAINLTAPGGHGPGDVVPPRVYAGYLHPGSRAGVSPPPPPPRGQFAGSSQDVGYGGAARAHAPALVICGPRFANAVSPAPSAALPSLEGRDPSPPGWARRYPELWMWWQREGRQNPQSAQRRLAALEAQCSASRFDREGEFLKLEIAKLDLAVQELRQTCHESLQRGPSTAFVP